MSHFYGHKIKDNITMIICCCNPFNDKAVKEHLDELDKKPDVKDVYNHCSGGKSFNCGSCARTIKNMIDEKFSSEDGQDENNRPADEDKTSSTKPCCRGNCHAHKP